MKIFLLGTSFLFFQLWLKGSPEDNNHILPPEHRLNGSSVSRALELPKDAILKSTVGVFRNGKLIAHGVLVDSRGFLLTKASSSVGARTIQSFNKESFSIRIRKRDEGTDLALWQIASSSLSWPTVSWLHEANMTKIGSWVLSAGQEVEDFRLGVISANSRTIGREGGVMGVILEETNSSKEGIQVLEVLPQAGGDRAGLKVYDKILKVDGKPVRKTEQIHRVIQNKDPGDLVILEVNRKDRKLVLRVTLGHRAVAFDLFNRNLLMSGPVSKRKDNFPLILQHDLPLGKELMGGGLYDLNGRCLGINISRVDRVTTYTLPASVVYPILDRWLGEFPQ